MNAVQINRGNLPVVNDTLTDANGAVIRRAADIAAGSAIEARTADGTLLATVTGRRD